MCKIGAEEFLSKYNDLQNWQAVADFYNVSRSTVYRVLRKNGVRLQVSYTVTSTGK